MSKNIIPDFFEENYLIHSSICYFDYAPARFSLNNVEELIAISGAYFVCKFLDSSVIITQSKLTVQAEDFIKVRHQIQMGFSKVIQKLKDKYDVEFSFKKLITTNVI